MNKVINKFTLVLFFIVFYNCTSFQFQLPFTTYKCFQENFPNRYDFYGEIEILGPKLYKKYQRIEFRVFDAQANIIIEKTNFVKEKFLYFAINGGVYSFCFYSIPLKEPSKQGSTYLNFKFLKGSQTHLFLGKLEELATIKELRRQFKYPLRDLEDQTKEMYYDYVGMIQNEKILREKSDQVSDYVLYLFVIIFFTLMIISYLQIKYYESYLNSQRNRLPN